MIAGGDIVESTLAFVGPVVSLSRVVGSSPRSAEKFQETRFEGTEDREGTLDRIERSRSRAFTVEVDEVEPGAEKEMSSSWKLWT